MFSPEGYQVLRNAAGLVRRADRGVLSATGADRLSWLQGLVTNDVLALPVGGVCDAAYLTPQGRMITDMRVVNLADRVLLDVPGSLAESLRARLDALIFAEDARIVDMSAMLTIVDLHGPAAPAVRAAAADALAHEAEAIVDDAPFGVPGCSVFVPVARADGVVNALTAAGATETTLATLDVLRVEAGRPVFLIDMDEHTIPLEAGLEDRAISFTKGCYVGQEVIVRVVHRGGGRVARRLVGLRLQRGELPQSDDPILAADREIGRVTSAVWSPALQAGIALGYVHRDFVAPGTAVAVRTASGVLAGTINRLPFV
jgi:folate-binding protein YgfZ